MNSNSRIISTDEDPSLRIESFAILHLRGVSTKLNKYITPPCKRTTNLFSYFIVTKNGFSLHKHCVNVTNHL